MSMSMADLLALVRDSVLRPRGVVRRLLETDIPAGTLWSILLLMAIVVGTMAWAMVSSLPADELQIDPSRIPGPIAMSAMQFVLLALCVPLVHRAGRMFGGAGDGIGALKVIVWWQAMTLVLQLAEMVVVMLLPFLGVLAVIATFGAIFWTLTNGVAELHGFRSLALVLIGIVMTGVTLVFVLRILVALLSAGQIGAV